MRFWPLTASTLAPVSSKARDTERAMSQEDPETVAVRAVEAWTRGDLECLLSIYSPDVEWDFRHFDGWPEEPIIKGRNDVRTFLEEWREMFGDYDYGVERWVTAGDRVVAICWQRGRGRESTEPVLMEFAQLMTVREGKIIRLENYSERSEALEAVGLRE